MSSVIWRMTVYDLAAGASCTLPPESHAFVYAAEGKVNAAGQDIGKGLGSFATTGARISVSGTAWIFEIAPAALPIRSGEGLVPVLSRLVELPEGSHMLRADRVEAPAGAKTPAHRHRGPGIRRLERGLLLAHVGDGYDRIGPGQAWFENGHETVVGLNISGGTNAFVRVMLLPVSLAGGQSSFIPANPDEASKPRAVNLQLFGEHQLGG